MTLTVRRRQNARNLLSTARLLREVCGINFVFSYVTCFNMCLNILYHVTARNGSVITYFGFVFQLVIFSHELVRSSVLRVNSSPAAMKTFARPEAWLTSLHLECDLKNELLKSDEG